EQVEDALGAGHRGTALHTRPARVISNAGPPRSLTERARAPYTRRDGPPALRRAPPLPQRAPRLARGQPAAPLAGGPARPGRHRDEPDRAASRLAEEALPGRLPGYGLAPRVGRPGRHRGREVEHGCRARAR